jgi:hypothetical protein
MIKELIARKIVNRAESTEPDIEKWDGLQIPTDPEKFNDSFYFTGHSRNGSYVITRLGLRSGGYTEIWFDCKLPQAGKISFKRRDEIRGEGITFGPLTYEPIAAGKKWKIIHQGRCEVGGVETEIFFNATFEAHTRVIDFKRDADYKSVARYLAKEKWTIGWFKKLKDLSQVHYEQGGTLSGFIQYEGKKENFELMSLRDHSFGTRDWKAMMRHLWLSALFEDGSCLNISLVSYSFLSFLHSGYYAKGDEVIPVTKADDFSVVPEGDPVGDSFVIHFSLGDRQTSITCQVNDAVDYTMMASYRICEGVASFTWDDKPGAGICEIGVRLDP